MSAKWRALQHRHRYTYTAIVVPLDYTERLNSLPSDVSSLNFFIQLKELISLNSVYSQVDHVKKVASAFAELLGNGGESVVSEAISFYLEILFIENSLPLHRTMVSVLAKGRKSQSAIANCFRRLCDEYGVLGRKGKRFCVSRVALSLINCPKLGFLVEVVEECSILAALDIAVGLSGMVMEVDDGSRPSPVVMEQCQEALSCLYYLLHRFPAKFIDVNCRSYSVIPKDYTILEFVMDAILSILKSSAFSRDSLVAAGVSFFAALQVHLRPEELSFFIVKIFSFHTSGEFIISGKSENGYMDPTLPFKGDLHSEIGKFSALSRLCLLRGILTAVPRAVISTQFDLVGGTNNSCVHVPSGNSVWTILFNAILPELCDYCENPIDAHFNFHVLTVMQICLQQIKTSLSSGLVFLSDSYNPLPKDIGSRILRIIWNNLEDPLSQTVKQVHLIFDLFLDIQASLQSAGGSIKNKSYLRKTASDLLCLGRRCKGRYVPLASLTKRLGANNLLQMNANLLFETIYAYIDDDVCCAATSFLKCFLECLRDECWNSDGIEKGYMIFRGHCLPPLMLGLVSGIPKLRSNLNTYALSVMLEVDVDSIFPMLNFISCSPNGEDNEFSLPELENTKMSLTVDQLVSALVSLLKVSRSLALIEGDIDLLTGSAMLLNGFGSREDDFNQFAVVHIKNIEVKVCLRWLVLALTHIDETLRIDAAESLFLNPKTSSLPSHLELSLLKEAVPLNMRCCSTAFQMKWTSLFRKFFSRVRTALERQFKQGHWQPLVSVGGNRVDVTMGTNENRAYKAEALFHFMKWLSCFLFFSCYPSAPYERKIMAMELILIMFSTWSIAPLSQAPTSAICLYPYSEGFISPDSTLLLVGSIIDSWDRLRESSFRILLQFPTPLPGILSQEQVRQVIEWAKMSVCSPRVRESDAGALTLRLIFRKYVLELGWFVGASVKTVCFDGQSKLLNCSTETSKSKFPVIEYILSLIDWLRAAVEEGEKDLSEACKNSFVHGVLLSLRYTFEELDWNSVIALSSTSEMRNALGMLLELVMRITSLALWVVSADAWYLPDDTDDMVCEDALLSDMPVEMTVPGSSLENEIKDLNAADSIRPAEQVVMVACWLAMKEISLLLGTITRKIPLPSCSSLDSIKCCDSVFKEADVSSRETSDNILDFKQIEAIGSHFLEVLLKMKHNGAIDKTRAGFTALCNRLLCSNDPRLCQMTESWMDQLMERTIAKGQTVDDLLRRSAGIPAAFIALFLSEPEGTPKKLLPRALRWLIDVANTSLHTTTETNPPNDPVSQHTLNDPSKAPILALSNEVIVSEKASKLRDEGVIPTVHAFNVLRAAFNDTNLATDTSGFSAEALIISIRSFSSPYWEVRNSACLAYTSLVRRMIGFLNVQKRESARRALTAVEFFHRYPSLHSFMCNELKIATEFLGDVSKDLRSNLAMVVHPSLCPVLILLSRLKPSSINSDAEDGLDPFLFMPLIRRCSMQNNFRVRVLASRALSGLVSNEKLPTVLFNIASELPYTEISTISSGSVTTCKETRTASFNSIHGMLLQLGHLLDVNCRDLVDTSKKDQILGTLIQVLIKCSWIGSPRLCPCSILNCTYVQVLEHMLAIARTCKMSIHADAIRRLLVELSLECLDTSVSHEFSFYDPAKAELRRQAAVSYLNCTFCARVEAVDEGFQMLQEHSQSAMQSLDVSETDCGVVEVAQRLVHLVSDESYEVRIATLKWLLGILKTIPLGGSIVQCVNDITNLQKWARTNLQPTLIQLLSTENNSRCTSYILRILFTWNKMQFQKPQSQLCQGTIFVGSMDCDDILLFWDKLISLNNVFRHRKIQEGLICCMGLCVKKFISLFRSSIFLDIGGKKTINLSALEDSDKWVIIYKCVCSFISVIGRHSDSSEPVNMRKAAADSMVASGLLEEAGYIYEFVANTHLPSEEPCSFKTSEAANMYGCRILDAWFTCIKLLEDEDVGLREDLAKEVQNCFAIKTFGRTHHVDAATVPTQVEKVIESSFEFLSSVFGHWLWYFEYLTRCVLNTTSYMLLPQGDLVRRVFDKEIDNHHEEKLLICQFCCLHLETLPMSVSWAVGLPDIHEVATFLHRWRKRFYDQLVSFSRDHMKIDDRVDWIGGAGNHKDVFISLYANILGLYALSQCVFLREIEISTPQFAELIDLGEIMKLFLNNPVLFNMYWLVLQSHRKTSDVVMDSLEPKSGDYLIWEGFDPYFLLR